MMRTQQERVVINKTIEASSSGYPPNRDSSAVDNSSQSRNPSDSSMRNTTVDEEEEKAFIEKYFSKNERRGNSLTPEMLDKGRRRLTSVVEAKERLKKQPYSESIKHLRRLSSTISPAEKLEIISEVCKKVDENVLKFWKGVQVKTEKLQLTADQYLAIIMYIVVKARIKDLEAQMFLVEQFIDDFTLNVTREGYMFLTVKQAVQFLKNVDEDKVEEEGYLKSLIEIKR